MSQPVTYNRVASFTNFQAVNPTSPLPGASVDAEFNAVKTTLDQTLQNLSLVQRDDGALANGSVGRDQLSSDIPVGFDVPTAWATSTAYTTTNTVFHGSGFYSCLVAHTSGTFATDLAAGKWVLIVDLSAVPLTDATQVAVAPTGDIASVTVQAALAELDTEKSPLSHTHVATAISDSSSAGRTLLTAANVAAQLAALGLAGATPLYGEMRDTAAIVAPALWAFCYGQAKSRTTYSGAFNAITIQQTGNRTSGSPIVTGLADTTDMRAGMPLSGTGVPGSTTILTVDSPTQITMSGNAASGSATPTALVIAPWGVGDGSTTFNLPDMRGRVRAGRDDMGGSSAGRVAGRLAENFGSATHTLTQAELPSVNFTVTGTAAAQTITDSRTWSIATASTGANAFGSNVPARGTTAANATEAATPSGSITNSTSAVTGTAASAGSGTAFSIVQPMGIVNTIIYLGV